MDDENDFLPARQAPLKLKLKPHTGCQQDARLVERVCELAGKGWSLARIDGELHNQGFTNSAGTLWPRRSDGCVLRRILKSHGIAEVAAPAESARPKLTQRAPPAAPRPTQRPKPITPANSQSSASVMPADASRKRPLPLVADDDDDFFGTAGASLPQPAPKRPTESAESRPAKRERSKDVSNGATTSRAPAGGAGAVVLEVEAPTTAGAEAGLSVLPQEALMPLDAQVDAATAQPIAAAREEQAEERAEERAEEQEVEQRAEEQEVEERAEEQEVEEQQSEEQQSEEQQPAEPEGAPAAAEDAARETAAAEAEASQPEASHAAGPAMSGAGEVVEEATGAMAMAVDEEGPAEPPEEAAAAAVETAAAQDRAAESEAAEGGAAEEGEAAGQASVVEEAALPRAAEARNDDDFNDEPGQLYHRMAAAAARQAGAGRGGGGGGGGGRRVRKRNNQATAGRGSSTQALPPPDERIEQAGEHCPLCRQPWHRSDRHQLCSLACGHLFGRCCVNEALRDEAACAVCRARSAPADVWLLYAANEVQPDSAQLRGRLDEIGQVLQQERQLQLAAERRSAQLRASGTALQQQCGALLRDLQKMR